MDNLILLGEYGSVAQGTATDNSDHDYMGVVIETEAQMLGLDHYETKRSSDAKQGEKSKAGESDTTYHGLRKFSQLAAGGNPTVGSILYLPSYEVMTEAGSALVENRQLFWSQRGVRAYLGYLHSQIAALEGKRGQKRPDLEAEHGYDIKFAYHAYRLGVQGVYYAQIGDPVIPMMGQELSLARGIRAGVFSYADVMLLLAEVEDNLFGLMNDADRLAIPRDPDYDGINKLLVNLYQWTWAD